MTDVERVDKFRTKILTTYQNITVQPYNEVYKDIFVGQAPSAEFVPPVVDAVLNLRAEDQDTLKVPVTLWMPIWDRPPFPGIEWLATAVEFLESNQKKGWKTYVHCNLGISRSGMVMLAFVMKQHNLSMEYAWKSIYDKRIVAPNASFCFGLCEWEATNLKQHAI